MAVSNPSSKMGRRRISAITVDVIRVTWRYAIDDAYRLPRGSMQETGLPREACFFIGKTCFGPVPDRTPYG